MTDTDPHIHLFAGAYALDALDDLERARFERHLAGCAACREEVAGYREAAATLAEATAEPPPASLRDRILAEVEQTPQLPPVTPVPSDARVWLDRNLHRVAAVLAGLAIALGGANFWLIQDTAGPPTDGEATTLTAWLEDARSVALDAPEGSQVMWMWSDATNQGVLAVDDMPSVGPSEDYQLWLFHDGEPVPAGVFDPGEGLQLVQAEAPARGAEVVAVTVEPAGGVEQPTGEIIASVELSAR